MTINHYDRLGLTRQASEEDIKQAYRRMAMRYHPDRNLEDPATAAIAFREIKEAYEVLKTPSRRALYDRTLTHHTVAPAAKTTSTAQAAPAAPASPPPVPPKPPGKTLETTVSVDVPSALNGGTVTFAFKAVHDCPVCTGSGILHKKAACSNCAGTGWKAGKKAPHKRQRCRVCSGRGKTDQQPCLVCKKKGVIRAKRKLTVPVPPGVHNGTIIRVKGAGAPSLAGGPPGDLLCAVKLKASKAYGYEGLDLKATVKVDCITALLGGTASFKHLDGSLLEVVVPPMTKAGATLTVSGHGLPEPRTTRRGNLLLKVELTLPKGLRRLSAVQEQLLREAFEKSTA